MVTLQLWLRKSPDLGDGCVLGGAGTGDGKSKGAHTAQGTGAEYLGAWRLEGLGWMSH
jgi:hypothetical protein